MSILLIIVLIIAFLINYFFAFIFLHGESSGKILNETFRIVIILLPGAAILFVCYIIIRIVISNTMKGSK